MSARVRDNGDEPSDPNKRLSVLYDDSIEVFDAEEVPTPPSSRDGSQVDKHNANTTELLASQVQMVRRSSQSHLIAQGIKGGVSPPSDASDNSNDEEDDDEDDNVVKAPSKQTYDPSEFELLNVPQDVKDLFQFIKSYSPQVLDLEYKLRPFIPDYIPAVGDIDAFLKVPRPDGVNDGIGLTVLDEPCTVQSEPALLHLQLRALAKQSSAKAVLVKQVQDAEKNGKAIDKWIRDISDLHRSKPPPTVHYTRPMPEIDNLLQEWPQEVEERLAQSGLPTAGLQCDLTTYVDIVCGLLDIPVYESRIQSLHVLFSLFGAVKNAKHIHDISSDQVHDALPQ